MTEISGSGRRTPQRHLDGVISVHATRTTCGRTSPECRMLQEVEGLSTSWSIRHHRRCQRVDTFPTPPGFFIITHYVGIPVGESQRRKSAKSAFATKGRKFASLTSKFIHF